MIINNIQQNLRLAGADACLISTNVNLYYCTGRIFTGYCYIPAEGSPLCLVKAGKLNDSDFALHKPEQILEILAKAAYPKPEAILLELGEISWLAAERLKAAMNPKTCGDATAFLRQLRMFKNADEIQQLEISCQRHVSAYREIPHIYQHGMSDLEFQHAMEYVMRRHGSLGVFRTFGSNMEIFAGSILVGNNAEAESPFDFALGGAGQHASLPIGANGTTLEQGKSVMVDMGGSFTPYLSDITRTYSIGKLCNKAYRAHQVSIDMHNWFRSEVKPGTPCAEIYGVCMKIADQHGLADCFMGTKHQAKFVGHGVGLQINELPILTPRSDEIIAANMTIAFEPKFVIPGVGATGVENTYLITQTGVENLSILDEEIMDMISD
ncbi:MAG: Xaa-Pro peptidase family protein [Prevotellaceae bacterium]|jgi:Xaa-Pro aminopeptidase|nr:Xaa-Pro peptidase family protein [Prevotellaceae bacterium]